MPPHSLILITNKTIDKKEWLLWVLSLTIVLISNLACPSPDPLTLAAKGNVWAQILMIIFSILYGIISFRFRYWGEMITYLGMPLPMTVWSTVTWIKNPSY